MSTIDTLGIQGIRSFGPDLEDLQKVKFFHPLTLIVGPNGTGKTTIIECLKYGATGDTPPGCKTNGAFVHDPKLAKEREIKGKVKLMINDVTGQKMTVERIISASVKDAAGKKIQMKTLDGVLSRWDKEGNLQQITSRCTDLNREMIGALGVSKAVLESVIFCHQEDSSWPLQEGKSVKERFDAIFASTRYSKAMDEVNKIKKSQDAEIKEGKKELEYLKLHKEKSTQLQGDHEQLKMQLAASEDSVAKVEEKLQPVKERLSDLNTKARELQDLQNIKYKYTSQKEQMQKSIEELSSKIDEEFTGSTEELQRQLKQFATQVQTKNRELQECTRSQSKNNAELIRIEKDINRLAVDSGKLQQEAETNSKKVKERDLKILELSELYGFQGFEGQTSISDELYNHFFQMMKEKLYTMMEDGKAKKEEFELEEKNLQEKIDSLRESKAKLESGERIKRETMERNKGEIKEIKQKLSDMMTSEGRLAGLKAELSRAENELGATEAGVNTDELKEEIAGLDRQKRLLDGEISELNTETNHLLKQSGIQAQLDMFQTDLRSKESSIKQLRSTHEDSIVSLLGHMPVDDLREKVDSYITKQNDSVRRCNISVRDLRQVMVTKEVEKKNTKTQIDQKEGELRAQMDKLYSVCEGQDLDEAITAVQVTLKDSQEEKGSLNGIEFQYKKYIKNLEKNNPDCPLCHRGFERAQEARELILKLNRDMKKIPSMTEKSATKIEQSQQQYDKLMQLRPVKEMVATLQDKEIPALKTKFKKLEEEVKKLKEDLSNKEDSLMLLEADLDIAKGLQTDVVSMDRYKGEARELERKIQTQNALLPRGGGTRSMDEVIALKEEKQLSSDSINRNLDHKREKLGEYQDKLQRLRSQVHKLKEEKQIIEGDLQQKTKMEERRGLLQGENECLDRETKEARSQVKPIEVSIRKVEEEKGELTNEKDAIIDKARSDVFSDKNKGISVKTINTEIVSYKKSGKADKLQECQEKQTDMKTTQKNKEEEKKELEGQIQGLREDVTRQDIKKRSLEDTLTLRQKETEMEVVDAKVQELKVKLGSFDAKSLQQERNKLMEQEDQMREDLHKATGRQQGFRDQIRSTRKELDSDMYKDADVKYRNKGIVNMTLEICNQDLQKYYKATDMAVMRYHREKMDEINIIIRDIWRETYCGNDIETIEIRSEDDPATGKEAVIKTKRTFNYRVVMVKNGIPIDMRGRCSAGQKVLACLIIRLALAETFCVNCGILALDEPTTNLDRANIESLAFSLMKIIRERSATRHFQLVVITHDEDFVELLGRSEFVEEYISVEKNSEGLSRLKMRKVQELHT